MLVISYTMKPYLLNTTRDCRVLHARRIRKKTDAHVVARMAQKQLSRQAKSDNKIGLRAMFTTR